MEHRELEELLTPYLLGDATPEVSEQVARHLDDCESCRALAQELELTLDLLHDALAAEAPTTSLRLSDERRAAIFRSRRPGWISYITDHRRGLGYAAAAASVMALLSAMLIPRVQPAGSALSGGTDLRMVRTSPSTDLDSYKSLVDDLAAAPSGPASMPRGRAVISEEALGQKNSRYEVEAARGRGKWEAGDSLGLDAGLVDEESINSSQKPDLFYRMLAVPESPPGRPSGGGYGYAEALEGSAPVLADEIQEIEPDDDFTVVKDGYARGESLQWSEAQRGQTMREDTMWMGAAADTREFDVYSADGGMMDGVVAGAIVVSGEARLEENFAFHDAQGSMDGVADKPGESTEESDEVQLRFGLYGSDSVGMAAAIEPVPDRSAQEERFVVDRLRAEPEVAGSMVRSVGQGLEAGKPAELLDLAIISKGSTVSFNAAEQVADVDFDDVALTQGADSSRRTRAPKSQSVTRGFEDLNQLASDMVPVEESVEAVPAFGDVPTLGVLFEQKEARKLVEDMSGQPVFLGYGVNPYRVVAQQPISTFGIDVDTASYTLTRRYIDGGSRPPPEAVRTEEFVNFFDYDLRPPVARTFAIHASGAPALFGEGMLVKIGVKGKRLGRDDQKPSVLTFVVDTSGSMDTDDRLGLVKTSLHLLLGELNPADRVAIVQVDSEARLVLEHTPAVQVDAITAAIDGLQCSGSTHLDVGIELGYDVAVGGFTGGAVNRVLILSDGAANLGSANPDEILARVAAGRKQGIVSSVFGFGLGTYNDAMLETLANRGDGTYHFIDSEVEAQRVFVDDLSAALNVIARDVKIQVEFDPARVAQYRQLGYENRQLKTEDFRNDSVDAGEVGSGQSVTALYEVILTEETHGPLGVVRVRYRDEQTHRIEEMSRELRGDDLVASVQETDAQFRLAACVAEFAELLRTSPFAADGSFDAVADVLRPISLDLHLDQRVRELQNLVRRAGSLPAPAANP